MKMRQGRFCGGVFQRRIAMVLRNLSLAAGLLFVAGCEAPQTRLPAADIPLRNPTAPIASQADAGLARLSGTWRIVQSARLAPGTELEFTAQALRIGSARLPLAEDGAGRLRLGDEALWVHWIDFDNRTAALGNPDGRRVWIIDRGAPSADRLKAARDILEWYGYDLGRMRGG